jgi:hypothetical protein
VYVQQATNLGLEAPENPSVLDRIMFAAQCADLSPAADEEKEEEEETSSSSSKKKRTSSVSKPKPKAKRSRKAASSSAVPMDVVDIAAAEDIFEEERKDLQAKLEQERKEIMGEAQQIRDDANKECSFFLGKADAAYKKATAERNQARETLQTETERLEREHTEAMDMAKAELVRLSLSLSFFMFAHVCVVSIRSLPMPRSARSTSPTRLSLPRCRRTRTTPPRCRQTTPLLSS